MPDALQRTLPAGRAACASARGTLPTVLAGLWLLATLAGPAAPSAHAQVQEVAAPAVAEQGFRRQRLKLRQELAEAFPIDLTGNGLQDLVVIETDPASRRPRSFLTVFLQSPQGFREAPLAARELPANIMLANVGRFSFGPGLLLLLPERLLLLPWRNGRFDEDGRPGLTVETVFTQNPGTFKSGIDWIVDINGDGINEILVPALHGFTIVREGIGGGLQRMARLQVYSDPSVINYYRRLYVAHEIPAFRIVDIDGQGWPDLVVYNEGLLQIFLLDGNVDPALRSPDMERDFQPPKPFVPKEPWDPPLLLMEASDINGDGILDLVFSKNAAAETDLKASTRVLIYYGLRKDPAGPIDFPDKPDQVYASEGFTLPLVKDINHDGRQDLVLVNVEINFWNSIKALIARTVTAEAAFYLMPAGGRYNREPSEIIGYSIKFSLGRFTHQPLSIFGDLNGDGLPDLLLSLDKERLGVHWGRQGAFWPSDYDEVLEDFLPIRGKRVKVVDLNRDGRDDLVLEYNRDDIRQMPEMFKTLTVLLSNFPPRGRK